MADAMLGKTLPTVTLASSAGGNVTLPKDWKGKWTILYFYPKDDTPGCTKQACSYRDQMTDFRERGIQVFGVSMDDLASHGAFISKFSLNFPLLVDADHKLADALGTYVDKEKEGRKYKGLSRDSFLIDPNGKIVEVWRGVDPTVTAAQTLEAALSRAE